jgi:hypothetical protein
LTVRRFLVSSLRSVTSSSTSLSCVATAAAFGQAAEHVEQDIDVADRVHKALPGGLDLRDVLGGLLHTGHLTGRYDAEQPLQAVGGVRGGQWDGAGARVLGDQPQRPGHAQRLPLQETGQLDRVVADARGDQLLVVRLGQIHVLLSEGFGEHRLDLRCPEQGVGQADPVAPLARRSASASCSAWPPSPV